MDEQKVIFTYPDGFVEAANSLQFLPDEESRKKFLATLAATIIKM